MILHFCRLFLTWYNPVSEEDSKLRHILGTFFPLYASMSRANQVTGGLDSLFKDNHCFFHPP